MSRDECKERRQKLICEFQHLLDCIDNGANQPSCPPPHVSDQSSRDRQSDRRIQQAIAKEEADRKRQRDFENMPLITGSAVLQIRPTSNLHFLDLKIPGVKYVDIREHAKEMREREQAKCKGKSDESQAKCKPKSDESQYKCYSMVTICDPCCPSRSQTFMCPVPCPTRHMPSQSSIPRPIMCPVSSQPSTQYVCYPFQEDSSKTKDRPLPPWHKDRYKSRELKGGVLLTGCDCTRRNGLQHDCKRSDCLGRPPCLLKPDPDCLPSGGTGLRGAEPRVSKYPYKPEECPPKPQLERGPQKPDPCHRAEVDCVKCAPTVLMCRPGECPGGRRSSDSELYESGQKRGSSQSYKFYECRPKEGSQSNLFECRPKNSHSSHQQYTESMPQSQQPASKSSNHCPSNQVPRPDFCPPKYDQRGREQCSPSHPQPVQRILALECRDRDSSSRHSMRGPDSRSPTEPRYQQYYTEGMPQSQQSASKSSNHCPSNQVPRPDFCPPKYDQRGREQCSPSHPQPAQRTSRHSMRCPDPSYPTEPRCPPNPCCPPYCEPPTHILKRPAYEKLPPPPECKKPMWSHQTGNRNQPHIVELQSGQLYKCDCLKANGLQDDCHLKDCGIPECLFRPPECYPSGGSGPKRNLPSNKYDSEKQPSSSNVFECCYIQCP